MPFDTIYQDGDVTLANRETTSAHSTAWRLATVLLIFALAWDALDPALRPPHGFVLASYGLLGFVCTASFSQRTWIGILLAMAAAIGLELLQSLVPLRDVRGIDLLLKWGCVLAGVILELLVNLLRQTLGRPGG
ncbi:hypothetical protein [Devosia faecipullorum]|uniref:hypothetical protein n=1 Tax=Devosia faecipullorum TaxID=2755039 RepID=UPI00187B8F4D|nr:hypothetical protein [Devosia faecipullorum]MBE7731979.1 hypothetical protein [Devosia faecipullorum]